MKITRRVLLASAALIVGAPRAVWGCGRRGRRRRTGEVLNSSAPATATATPPRTVRTDEYPNLEAWNKVRVGMTEQEAIALVGQPKSKPGSDIKIIASVPQTYVWDYGGMQFASDALPAPMRFELHIKQGRVTGIEDPFDHIAPAVGAPGVPRLLSPRDGTWFNHYPRYIDLRWWPLAPQGSIAYEIALEVEQFSDDGPRFIPFTNSTSAIPYLAVDFVGMQAGQWRVRARNGNGVSDWSEYRTFTFSV